MYNNYSTETDNPAWNMPSFTGDFTLNYSFLKDFTLALQAYFVGPREDLATIALPGLEPSEFDATVIELDSFLDANLSLNYAWNEQLNFFVSLNNLANNSYQRWTYYNVQGFQAMGGLSYKFDL